MPKLADLSKTIENARNVLGKPNSFKREVFDITNGKLTAPEIGKILNKKPTNVSLALADLFNKGLLESAGKRGKATIYKKIPELRGTNLKSYSGNKTRVESVSNEQKLIRTNKLRLEINSKAIDKVITIGKKYGIENIDQNWVDALVILNFIETATTKFLMIHGYTEEQVKKWQWEEKIQKLHDKLQEESKKKGISLRSATLAIIKNYREQRNNVDHIAHLDSSKVDSTELTLLLNIMKVFVKEVFEEHTKYCLITP